MFGLASRPNALVASITLLITFLLGNSPLLAQDRVALFEIPRADEPERPLVVRDVIIADNGRGWNSRLVTELPHHFISGAPAVVAGGRWLTWLAFESPGSMALVYYDVETGHAGIASARRFDPNAVVVADPLRPRVFVVEPRQIVVVDATLHERIIPIPVSYVIGLVAIGGRRLIVQRYEPADVLLTDDLIVVDVDLETVTAILPLRRTTRMALTSDGQRLYRASSSGLEQRVDLVSLPDGQLLARNDDSGPAYLFELIEHRGVVVYDRGTAIVALDAQTLVPIGELGAGVFEQRREFALAETSSGAAIVVRSSQFAPSYFGNCVGPRLDVFDGATFALTNRIELTRCAAIVALPPSTMR